MDGYDRHLGKWYNIHTKGQKPMIKNQIRSKILQRVQKEIAISRNYKQSRTRMWHLNEKMYEGTKKELAPGRANVNLGQMHGYIQTLLSKIDNPLIFRAQPAEIADIKKAEIYNATTEQVAGADQWDMKGRLLNFQLLMYGRMVGHQSMHTTDKQLSSNLTPIDVHKFLIDPQSGGVDIDNAMYMGHYGVRLLEHEIEAGVKEGLYYKDVAKRVIQGDGDSHMNKEEMDANQRSVAKESLEASQDGVFFFWSWITTFKGKRYYVLYHEVTKEIMRLETLEDMQGHDQFPYWSAAAFPDLAHFWTQGYSDISRELIEVQNVNINQMIDNAQKRNYPERIVKEGSLKNPQRLQRFVPNGIITVSNSFQAGDFQTVDTPSIDSPMKVYDKVDQIVALNSGVTADMKGLSEEDKVGIYEGNQAQAADRLGLLDKNRSDGWKVFANLFYKGLKQNLTTNMAIKLVGLDGASYETVKIKDMIPAHDFDFRIESTRAEEEMNRKDRSNKITYLDTLVNAPDVNQKNLQRIRGEVAGLQRDELRALFDATGAANESVQAAEEDLQQLMMGKQPKKRMDYPMEYVEYMIKYGKSSVVDMSEKQFDSYNEFMQKIMGQPFQDTLVNQLSSEAAKTMDLQGQAMQGQLPPEQIQQAPQQRI